MTRHKEKVPKREVRCRWFAEELRKEVHWVVGYILYTSEDVSGSAFFKSFSRALQLAAFFRSVHQAEHLYKRSRLSLVPTISKFFKVRSAYLYQILHNKRRKLRLRSVFFKFSSRCKPLSQAAKRNITFTLMACKRLIDISLKSS